MPGILRGFATIVALSSFSLGSIHAAETIRVGVQAAPPDEVYLARNWGEPYGVDIDYTQFSSGGDMLQAFVAGRVDVANGGSARIVSLAANQPDLFYIIATHQFGGDRYGLLVRHDSDAETLEDLVGKTIAGVTGSGAWNTFRIYMENRGLSESDFDIVNMRVQELQSAIAQEIIDAGVAWEPFPSIMETAGVAKRIASMGEINQSPVFLMVRRDFADANPELVTRYVASVIDASEFMSDDSTAAGEMAAQAIAGRGVEIDPEALALSFTRFQVGHAVTDDLLAELVPIAESMQSANRIDHVPDFHALVEFRFYEQALQLRQEKTGS